MHTRFLFEKQVANRCGQNCNHKRTSLIHISAFHMYMKKSNGMCSLYGGFKLIDRFTYYWLRAECMMMMMMIMMKFNIRWNVDALNEIKDRKNRNRSYWAYWYFWRLNIEQRNIFQVGKESAPNEILDPLIVISIFSWIAALAFVAPDCCQDPSNRREHFHTNISTTGCCQCTD